jgi:hypothetical protein
MKRYRKECTEAAKQFIDSYGDGGIDLRAGNTPGTRCYSFQSGIFLNCVATRWGVDFLRVWEPGLVDGLLDMAENDGIVGRMMIYGVGLWFGLLSPGELEEDNQHRKESRRGGR